jgi:eukaryotic-like serine/threonine-protein kinase
MIESQDKLPILFGSVYLVDIIGKGGMAEIFLAKEFNNLGTEQLSVIKRILPGLSNRPGFGEMLIAEAKLCSRLSHGNVVQTYDLGQIDGQYYIGMEYVEGFDLNRLLSLCARAKLAIPLQFALFIIRETLRGLDYAHRVKDDEGNTLGIIHRDVSPTNVLISVDGDIKVCDFGIAKVTQGDDAKEIVDEYHMKGKVAYMAPEHLNGEPVDIRSDLYAAGILLWELLSGRRLFKTKDEAETLRRAKTVEVPPLADRGFSEFDKLNAIVTKALQKNPDNRYQNGREFIDALDDYMHTVGLIVSSIKFSEFLMDNFGEDLLKQRMEREQKLNELLASDKLPRPEETASEDKKDPDAESDPENEIDSDTENDPKNSDDAESIIDLHTKSVSVAKDKAVVDVVADAIIQGAPVAALSVSQAFVGNDKNKKRSFLAAAAVIAIAIAGAVAAFYFGQ